MDSAWVGVIGGVVGGTIATISSLGAVQLQARNARHSKHENLRREACTELLASSFMVSLFASALHLTMEIRSGLKEGLDVSTKLRRPGDPLELYEKIRPDIERMHRSVDTIWMLESQDVIKVANTVANLAVGVVGAATTRGEARGALSTTFFGEKWTQEQLDDWQTQMTALGEARREFNRVVRLHHKLPQVEVFTREN